MLAVSRLGAGELALVRFRKLTCLDTAEFAVVEFNAIAFAAEVVLEYLGPLAIAGPQAEPV